VLPVGDYTFWDALWTIFIFFLWILWFFLLFKIVFDVFRRHDIGGGSKTLWTIFVILLVLWALGMVSSYTLGGFIHLLLVIAIAVVLIRIIQGRRPV